MVKKNSRDLVGYGAKGKKVSWPNNAKLALHDLNKENITLEF